jgi:hypothetical protein
LGRAERLDILGDGVLIQTRECRTDYQQADGKGWQRKLATI